MADELKTDGYACRVVDLKKEYVLKSETVRALRGVTFDVPIGDYVAIMGPSGSGKSTLLNLLGCLDQPTAGSLWLGHDDVAKMSDDQLADIRSQRIGFVFQAYNLIPVLTARENVEFIMLLQKRPVEERRSRVAELLAQVGLSDKAGKRPSELSGGQQQRIAVARALAAKPRFVLADEPTANLDTASASNLLDIMARLNREEGMTFIFSTHDPRVIERARRVITLEDGRVVADESRNE